MAEPTPRVELVPVRGRARWEVLLASLGLAALLLAVLKPWPSVVEERQIRSPDSSGAVTSPVPTGTPPFALPPLALDPPATACFNEMDWRVCVLGTAGLAIRSWFGPAASREMAPEDRTVPVALLLTNGGAGLGFYAPMTGTKTMSGAVWVSAWRTDDPVSGIASIPLRTVSPPGLDASLGPSFYLTSSDALALATRWPAGRYAFLLQSADGSHREEYFGLEIFPASEPPNARAPSALIAAR